MATASWNSLGTCLVKCSASKYESSKSNRSERFDVSERIPSSGPIGMSIKDTEKYVHARSSNGVSIVAAVAAAAVAGISYFSTASFALASDLDASHFTPVAMVAPQEYSLSIAIPIPQQGVWVFAQKGFIAPLPVKPNDGFIAPYRRAEKDMVSQGSYLRCPQWKPIEFEMVLPDYQGRPKPFPRRGYQWAAVFVVKDSDGAPLPASSLEDEIASAQSEVGAISSEGKNDQTWPEHQMEGDGKSSAPKALARFVKGEKFMCFSL